MAVYLVFFSPGYQERPHAFLIAIQSFPEQVQVLDSVWLVATDEPLDPVKVSRLYKDMMGIGGEGVVPRLIRCGIRLTGGK